MPTEHKLIGNNMALSIRVGPAWTGATPVFTGLTASIMGKARRVMVKTNLKSTDVSAMGSTTAENAYHKSDATLSLDTFLPATGYSFLDVGGAMIGKWIEVTTKPKSSLVASQVWVGVIVDWQWESEDENAQVEKIEIDLTPNYTP